jgi:hypothetical protein
MKNPALLLLIKGKASGSLLFLAWVLGVFVCHALRITLIIGGISDVLGLGACLLCLSVWESMILLPTWWRRLCWILIFYFLLIPVLEAMSTRAPYDPVLLAAMFQAVLLIGVRERVLLWALVAIVANPLARFIVEPMLFLYRLLSEELSPFIPARFILSFYHIYPVALTIVFGGIAAYFMPPVEQPEESRFAGESEI